MEGNPQIWKWDVGF